MNSVSTRTTITNGPSSLLYILLSVLHPLLYRSVNRLQYYDSVMRIDNFRFCSPSSPPPRTNPNASWKIWGFRFAYLVRYSFRKHCSAHRTLVLQKIWSTICTYSVYTIHIKHFFCVFVADGTFNHLSKKTFKKEKNFTNDNCFQSKNE